MGNEDSGGKDRICLTKWGKICARRLTNLVSRALYWDWQGMVIKAQREVEESIYLSQFIHPGLHVNFVHRQVFGVTQVAQLPGQHKQVQLFPELPASSGANCCVPS